MGSRHLAVLFCNKLLIFCQSFNLGISFPFWICSSDKPNQSLWLDFCLYYLLKQWTFSCTWNFQYLSLTNISIYSLNLINNYSATKSLVQQVVTVFIITLHYVRTNMIFKFTQEKTFKINIAKNSIIYNHWNPLRKFHSLENLSILKTEYLLLSLLCIYIYKRAELWLQKQ